jgi:V-type H+-transporting ATPase subunit H
LLTPEDAVLIKSIEKQVKDKKLVEGDVITFSATLARLLSGALREDVVKYLLGLASELVIESPKFADSLLQLSLTDESFPYEPFVKFLDTNEHQFLLAAKTLVVLFSLKKAPSKYVNTLFTFLSKKLAASPQQNFQDIAVQSYGVLLRTKWYRELFWNGAKERVPVLLSVLKGSRNNLQLQYNTLLVLWLITFETKPSADIITEFDIVPLYFDIIKNSVKEKIIRLSIATLVNTVTLAPSKAINSLLLNSGLTLSKTLSERKWADEELVDDLEKLTTTLQEAFNSMTTFDEYKAELDSKHLRWSPPHRLDTFWKDNAEKFKEQDWKVFKQLADIISSNNDEGGVDPVVLAVALNDISHVITEFPEAVKVIERLGIKVNIMELMNHANADVKYEALKTTQNFIAHTFK